MRNNKGQASVEFMTTYGWAFLIMIVMIGAMSYMGVLQPDSFIPERCQFGPDIVCEDFQVISYGEGTGSSVGIAMVQLRHTLGRSAYIQDFSCDDVTDTAISSGFLHADSDAIQDTNNEFTAPLPGAAIDADEEQWTSTEVVTLKCHLTPNAFEAAGTEKVRVPMTLLIKKRENGFDHVYEGDVVATVRAE